LVTRLDGGKDPAAFRFSGSFSAFTTPIDR
jgi:hypothetical protein